MPDGASHRTTPAREWNRPEPRRRPSNPGAPAPPAGYYPSAPPPSPGYFHPPPPGRHVEGLHSPAGPPFQSPSLHYTPPAYAQGASYYGQYTVPSQPTLSMAHSTPYPYTHAYHPLPGPESNLQRRDGFQSMVQPHPAPYSYPHRPQDESGSSTAPVTGPSASSPRYSSHPSSPTGAISQPYMSSGHFSGMTYPSPMGTPQFAYTQHFSATSPIYRPYGPMAYPQHATSAPEEAQGTWYFLSHGNAPAPHPQYHYDGAQYQNPYAGNADHVPFAPQPSVPSAARSSPAPLPAVPGTSQSAPPDAAPPLSAADGSRSGSTRPPSAPAENKTVARREWHPRPPPHRSPWVMWVGNVPSDATQDELSKFFSMGPDEGTASGEPGGAVVSIFLIARSNCAFINYANEPSLLAAIQYFNGKRLRPTDPQCPMFVCKVRRSADDLKSGVGGQRGTGLHAQWVKEQRRLQSQARASIDGATSSDASVSSHGGPMSLGEAPRPRGTNQSSSSESYASTSSSFLGEHFPTRYFILKSLSERDLELSVESGLWATQKHNELVLDRAYRTSANVYLIFSVNKSGEFYGFARMAGPIRQGEGSVSWSSRSRGSPPSQSSPLGVPFSSSDAQLIGEGPIYQSPEDLLRDTTKPPIFPTAIVTAQPAELGQNRQEFEHYASAPARLGGVDDSLDHSPSSVKLSLDQYQRRRTQASKPPFQLDPEAPRRAMKGHHAGNESGEEAALLPPVEEQHEGSRSEAVTSKPSPTWGDCFKVEWRELRKVPFHRTRHLRNAWNKGREIKVSRDGTELESGVGRRLLEEWDQLVEA